MAEYEVRCGSCGRKLDERADIPTEQRAPCPTCASRNRSVSITTGGVVDMRAEGALSIGGPVVATAVTHKFDSDSAEATEDATVDRAEVTSFGIQTTHSCTVRFAAVDDHVYAEVLNAAGEVLANGVGNSETDALLELICYMLPPDHPEFPEADPER